MKFLTNDTDTNTHADALKRLIEGSEVSILCSGWLKANVFATIRAAIEIGIERKASITIYSSKAETQLDAIGEAKKIIGLRHVIVAGSFMHSKLYYFRTGAAYTAIIGSANLTDGGLNGNREASVQFSGKVGDDMDIEIQAHLKTLHRGRAR